MTGIDQQNSHVSIDNGKKKFGAKDVATEQDITADSQVEIPLWLALPLAERDIVDLRPPEYIGDKYLQNLQAGPEILNFRKQSPAIYENVLKICAQLENN